jgi:hypothetical protein
MHTPVAPPLLLLDVLELAAALPLLCTAAPEHAAERLEQAGAAPGRAASVYVIAAFGVCTCVCVGVCAVGGAHECAFERVWLCEIVGWVHDDVLRWAMLHEHVLRWAMVHMCRKKA